MRSKNKFYPNWARNMAFNRWGLIDPPPAPHRRVRRVRVKGPNELNFLCELTRIAKKCWFGSIKFRNYLLNDDAEEVIGTMFQFNVSERFHDRKGTIMYQAPGQVQDPKSRIFRNFEIQIYFSFFSYRIDFQELKDPSHWIPGEKMVHFDVKTIVLAQKL